MSPQPLLPVRYKQPDLFSIDITGISVKDTQQHLEHPFFVLSTKPDTATRKYEDPLGNSIEVIPSSLGMPTILDKDVLIYAISHIVHRRNRGEPVSRRVVIYSADMLRFANRCQSGRDYAALERSLRRLAGCLVQTNVRTGNTVHTKIFSLLESADIQRKHIIRGRLMYCEITLSEWLWRAIEANEILTLHPDYFRLRRPLERRLYELARKHCGQQPSWSISLARLYQKCAVQSPLRTFRMQIRRIAATDVLPGYTIEYAPDRDRVRFLRRADDLIRMTLSTRLLGKPHRFSRPTTTSATSTANGTLGAKSRAYRHRATRLPPFLDSSRPLPSGASKLLLPATRRRAQTVRLSIQTP